MSNTKLNPLSVIAQKEHLRVAMQLHSLFTASIILAEPTLNASTWRERKWNTSFSVQAVAEVFPPPKVYTALGRKPIQID